MNRINSQLVEYKRLNHKNFGPRRRGTQRHVLPPPSMAGQLDDAAGCAGPPIPGAEGAEWRLLGTPIPGAAGDVD
jgi:hypothetical protein